MTESRAYTKDYYYILGITPESTTEEIQEAYHELYDKYGPHVTLGGQDPEMHLKTFKEISEAYEVLMDPAKRQDYDKHYRQYLQKGDLRALWTKYAGVKAPVEDAKKKPPAADFELEVTVTLKEAIKGGRKKVAFDEPKPCQDCVGFKPVQRLQCPTCRGVGFTLVERVEEIDLPPGLYEKLQLRKSELGKYDMQAGKRGDLIVRIKLAKHPFLEVLGRDLTLSVPITIHEAVLGAEIEVPTATGKVIMKVQPRTQPGRVYRLKGLGLAGADQLVTIEVVTPQQLTDEEISLFRRLQEMSKDPNPRQSLYGKI